MGELYGMEVSQNAYLNKAVKIFLIKKINKDKKLGNSLPVFLNIKVRSTM